VLNKVKGAKMDCREIEKLLVRFLEGELSSEDNAKLENHLAACPACRKEKELLPQSWKMLDNYPAPELKPDFTACLMQRIHTEEQMVATVRSGMPRFVMRTTVPATVMLALLFTFLWTSNLRLRGYQSEQPGAAYFSIRDNRDDLADTDLGTNLEMYFLR